MIFNINWNMVLKKSLVTLFLILVLIVLGGGIHLYIKADDMIRAVVTDVGSRATETKVKVGLVDLSFHEGKLLMAGTQIQNVKSFKSNTAVTIGSISLKVNPNSLTNNVVLIKEIVITDLDIAYEYMGEQSNFGSIRARVKSYCNRYKKRKSLENIKEPFGSFKFNAMSLLVSDGKIKFSSDRPLNSNSVVSLPRLYLKNFIKKDGGVTTNGLICEIIEVVVNHVSKSGDHGFSAVTKSIKQDDVESAKH